MTREERAAWWAAVDALAPFGSSLVTLMLVLAAGRGWIPYTLVVMGAAATCLFCAWVAPKPRRR